MVDALKAYFAYCICRYKTFTTHRQIFMCWLENYKARNE